MKLEAFFELTSLHYSFIIVFAVLTGEVVTANTIGVAIPLTATVFACLSAVLIQMGAFVIGDVFDIKTDRANKRRDKPLIKGTITKKEAHLLVYSTFFLGLVFAMLVNELCFLIAVTFTIIGVEYAYVLKKKPLVGNMAIAASAAIPLFFGNFVVSIQVPFAISTLALIAFLAIIGREITNGIRDMKGDKRGGRRTLPIVIGAKKAAYIASFFILIAVALSFIPFFYLPLYKHSLYYLAPILLCDFLFIYAVALTLHIKNMHKVRNMTAAAQLVAVIAFLIAALLA